MKAEFSITDSKSQPKWLTGDGIYVAKSGREIYLIFKQKWTLIYHAANQSFVGQQGTVYHDSFRSDLFTKLEESQTLTIKYTV